MRLTSLVSECKNSPSSGRPSTSSVASTSAPESPLCDRADRSGHLDRGPDEIIHEGIQSVHLVGPVADQAGETHALLKFSFLAHQMGSLGAVSIGPSFIHEPSTSLNASAILPCMPVHSTGRRTEKSPAAKRQDGLEQCLRGRFSVAFSARELILPRKIRSLRLRSGMGKGSPLSGEGDPFWEGRAFSSDEGLTTESEVFASRRWWKSAFG